MSELRSFDILQFKKLNRKEYEKVYRGQIRTSIIFNKIKNVKTGIKVYSDKEDIIYLCKYKKGDWRDGKPVKYERKINKNIAVVRVPAINIKDTNIYVTLDGNHRLTEVNPSYIIMDYMVIDKSNFMYVTELYNPEYKQYLGITEEKINVF